MKIATKSALLRLAIAAISVFLIVYADPLSDVGYAIFIVPAMFFAIYVWLGVAFFVVDLIWMLATKPEQRLFASIMIGSTVLVAVALAAAYWLIRDSIGLGATIAYAFGAYFVLSIVRWFRRHTASYYAALEQEQHEAVRSDIDTDRLS